MQGLLTLGLAVMVVAAATSGANADTNRHKADFYVSPSRSDAWSGVLADPNEQRNDGPFAALQRARDAVRALKQDKTTDIVVYVRGGTYQLAASVVFGLKDSGAGDSTITYAAYRPTRSNEQAVIT